MFRLSKFNFGHTYMFSLAKVELSVSQSLLLALLNTDKSSLFYPSFLFCSSIFTIVGHCVFAHYC